MTPVKKFCETSDIYLELTLIHLQYTFPTMKIKALFSRYSLVILYSVLSANVFSQWICGTAVSPFTPSVKDDINVIVSAGFPFGYQSTCPSLDTFEIFYNGDEVRLELYYDISGAWPQVGCSSTDTANTGKWSAGNYQLILYSNTIFDSDTNFHQDNDTLKIKVYDQAGLQYSEMEGSLKIYPNPARYLVFVDKPYDLKFSSVELYDLTGTLIKKFKSNSGYLNLEGISPGLYQLIFNTVHGRACRKLLIM